MMQESLLQDAGYKLLADLQAPLDLAELFGRGGSAELEIGAGRGDFMLEYAQLNPDVNFVAVERKQTVLKRMVNKLRHAQVGNVQVLNVEILHLLEHYLPPHSMRAVHIYFPDPWRKNPHAKRRLIQPGNMPLILRVLQPGGLLHFRTDHKDYNRAAMNVFESTSGLERIAETEPELLRIRTGFEKRFEQKGIAINRATFVYRP